MNFKPGSSRDSTQQFLDDVSKVVDYHRSEGDVTFIEMFGCLEYVKASLIAEMNEDNEEEE